MDLRFAAMGLGRPAKLAPFGRAGPAFETLYQQKGRNVNKEDPNTQATLKRALKSSTEITSSPLWTKEESFG